MDRQEILDEMKGSIQRKDCKGFMWFLQHRSQSLSVKELKEVSSQIISLIEKWGLKMEKCEQEQWKEARVIISRVTRWPEIIERSRKKRRRAEAKHRKATEEADEKRRKYAAKKDAIMRAWSGIHEDFNEPIVKNAIEIITGSLNKMTERQRQLWDAIKIVPAKWSFNPEGDRDNSSWVIGLFGNVAIWYNDTISSFVASKWKKRWVLVGSECKLGEFNSIIKHLDDNPECGISYFTDREEAENFANSMDELNMSVYLDRKTREGYIVKNEDVASYLSPEEEQLQLEELERLDANSSELSEEYGEYMVGLERMGPQTEEEEYMRELEREDDM